MVLKSRLPITIFLPIIFPSSGNNQGKGRMENNDHQLIYTRKQIHELQNQQENKKPKASINPHSLVT